MSEFSQDDLKTVLKYKNLLMSTRKMAIKITINEAAAGGADVEEVEEVQATVRLRLTRRLMEISSLKT